MKNLQYDHKKIEKKWQSDWQKKKIYKTLNNSKKKKHYVLDMFPYPSGAGLHVGHPRGYIGSDVYARMKRMQGFNVLHPMGFDSFGLPAEQYAIQTGKHPSVITDQSIKRYKEQLEVIGFSYDWEREVQTSDPAYYKWTQWIFLQIFNSWYDKKKNKARPISELEKIFARSGSNVDAIKDEKSISFSAKEWKSFSQKEKQNILMQYRLAYEGYAEVNWCPELGTVLANDEVIVKPDGSMVSERGEKPVIKKSMRQWFMRITAYAERLLLGLEKLDWSAHIKEVQRNWIGKSEGSVISFPLTFKKLDTPKKILIGTRNEAKFRMIKECMPKIPGVEFVSLNDVQGVDDSKLIEGQDFEKNARMKAQFYFHKTGIPTISTDNIFWLEKWHKDNGVVIHMRKEANPKSERATDEEILSYFKKWVKKNGDSRAHFVYAIAYADSKGVSSTTSTQREYILQGKQSKKFWDGYPMESLLIDVETGEYKGSQKNEVRYNKLIEKLETDVRHWISPNNLHIDVFTTRADTLFGVTYVVLSPEHLLLEKIKAHIENWAEVEKYILEAKKRSLEERTNTKEKSGVLLKGIYAKNQVNNEIVPVWVADYVLASYGTGAVMAVPAHDERDFEFAEKYDLPSRQVIVQSYGEKKPNETYVKGVCALIYDPETNAFAMLKWNHGLFGLVAGGLNTDEKIEDAIKREMIEESGLYDIKSIENLCYANAHFFNTAKQTNRDADTDCFLVVLSSRKTKPLQTEDHEQFELCWVTPEEILENWNKKNMTGGLDHWIDFLHKSLYRLKKLGYPVTLIREKETAYTGYGKLINSGIFNGLSEDEAKNKITKSANGKFVTKYKMRDAIFARQRYWGEPIPLFTDKKGLIHALPTQKLPLKLPNVKSYKPTGTGESPLASVSSWIKEGFETNTMPGWAGSSWYFLRYMDSKNKKVFADKKALTYWKNVDMYVGGTEHATGHLLYARFWHKVLKDYGYVREEEPFMTLKNQGMILGSDNRKMSKRWGNVINPDDVVKQFGADTLRVFEMFLGPFESALPWSTDGIVGSRRFIERVWKIKEYTKGNAKTSSQLESSLHKTIQKIENDIATFNFNTAVSAMMIFINEVEKEKSISKNDFLIFLKLLAPFAPHITEELWQEAGQKSSIHLSVWPKSNPNKCIAEKATIIIQVNGKVRGKIELEKDLEQKIVESKAKVLVASYLDTEAKRIIYVQNKLINFVL